LKKSKYAVETKNLSISWGKVNVLNQLNFELKDQSFFDKDYEKEFKKNKLIIIFIHYQRGLMNYSFYLIILLERPYLKSKKKGLTNVKPGDGEPYF